MSLVNIQTDLAAYWTLNESSGTRVDSIGSNNLIPNPTAVGSATGKVGEAAALTNSSENSLDVASSSVFAFDGTADFTISCWANLDTITPPDSDQAIFGKYGDNLTVVDQRAYLLFFDVSTDQFRALISETGAANSADVSPTLKISASTWYWLLMQYVAATKTLTLTINNGTGTSTASAAAVNAVIFDSDRAFRVGYAELSSNQGWLDGKVDELAIWNRVLAADEKASLYNGGSGVNLLDYLVLTTPKKISHYIRYLRKKARYGAT